MSFMYPNSRNTEVKYQVNKKRNAVAVYRLVQWTNGSVEDATSETLEKLSK
ncbi:hypothetical protein Tco_1135236, partial [Tanacetum coccineum]